MPLLRSTALLHAYTYPFHPILSRPPALLLTIIQFVVVSRALRLFGVGHGNWSTPAPSMRQITRTEQTLTATLLWNILSDHVTSHTENGKRSLVRPGRVGLAERRGGDREVGLVFSGDVVQGWTEYHQTVNYIFYKQYDSWNFQIYDNFLLSIIIIISLLVRITIFKMYNIKNT